MKILTDITSPCELAPRGNWPAWLPLAVLGAGSLFSPALLPPWGVMWCVVLAFFIGFKWMIWWNAVADGVDTTARRSLAYLSAWPGMDASRFLDEATRVEKPPRGAWISAAVNTAFGTALFWGVARLAGRGLAAGWIGMTGFIFVLHFGVIKLLALGWRRAGVSAQPFMRAPVAAASVGEFWGTRWNSAFRAISHGMLFRPLCARYGAAGAAMLAFFTSGLIHELAITFPAGGGYGLPTAYFTLQGAALLFERSAMATRWGMRGSWRGRIFAIAVIAGPAYALFPPPFVTRVFIPFMEVTKAL